MGGQENNQREGSLRGKVDTQEETSSLPEGWTIPELEMEAGRVPADMKKMTILEIQDFWQKSISTIQIMS